MHLTIDGQEVTVEDGLTILQACQVAGVEVPVFCYHPKLPIAGNCRMCLVQVEKAPKPVASCAMPAAEGMVVYTKTPMVHKARTGVLELLLINHPLDCPVCDQGGECDLQDITMGYGPDSSRFKENKRIVEDKNIGPLIKTSMTRCIHCTRCIRFCDEIAGTSEMGAVHRGEHTEITSYLERAISSELSGNMIDICPVGALTAKPSAFRARAWEYKKTETIDVLDAVGCNIRIDTRDMEIMRILPRLNESVNEEWISDKTRFSYDGLRLQRLDRPYVRKGNTLKEASWDEAFTKIISRFKSVKGPQVAALAGPMVEAESLYLLKHLMTHLGSPHLDCRTDGVAPLVDHETTYLFNSTIEGIEDSDACLLIGTHPRWEATLINARIRKRYLRGHYPIGLIGMPLDLTYPYDHLGAGPEILDSLLKGAHPFSQKLRDAERPLMIIGPGALARGDARGIQERSLKIAQMAKMIRPDWVGYNVLAPTASRVAGLTLGVLPGEKGWTTQEILHHTQDGQVQILYLLGVDDIDFSLIDRQKTFVIYQGHHGDEGARHADVILPGAAFSEKDGLYLNTEGRLQETIQALAPPHLAKADWRILEELCQRLGLTLMKFKDSDDLRAHMPESLTALSKPFLGPESFANKAQALTKIIDSFGKKLSPMTNEPLKVFIKNYYMNDPITRASKTMADCLAAGFGSNLDKVDLSLKKGQGA